MGCDVQVTSQKNGEKNDKEDAEIATYGAFGPTLVVLCRINHLRKCLASSERKSNGFYRSSGKAMARTVSSQNQN
jgi:hypothetical protein